jgi:histidyl-tRNA synthetase
MVDLCSQPVSTEGLAALRHRLGGPAEGAFASVSRIVDTVRAVAADRFRLTVDPTLVRGMGYYTGPIFEISSSSFAAGSIAGGGRYDHMIGALLGREVPATGFSIGFERVVDILGKLRSGAAREERRVALLFDEAAPEFGAVLRAAEALRGQGFLVALERRARSLGAQRAALEKQGYDGTATVGSAARPEVEWFAERPRRLQRETSG